MSRGTAGKGAKADRGLCLPVVEEVTTDVSYTMRTVHSESWADVRLDDGQIETVSVNVELLFEDGVGWKHRNHPTVLRVERRRVNIEKGRVAPLSRVDGFDDLRTDELEIFAHAMTEAVRLGRERGIIGAGGAK